MLIRSILYAFRGGFLIRPFVIALALGAAGAILSSLEEHEPAIAAFVPETLFPSHADPTTAQAILTDIATSIMTVVSIVFAILLMTLTLASTQFSPRILVSFVRDKVTQWTLGIFLGTFSFCIAALPAARSVPTPFVPVATVTVAMILAPVCVGWLIYFIHHISMAISVNHIVDRIRSETEQVIDALMPEKRRSFIMERRPLPPTDGEETAIPSRSSGYIRFIDIQRLRYFASAWRVCLRIERRIGHFVPEGVVLIRVSKSDQLSEEHIHRLLATIDIGPTRTMQQDIEFGVVQIVDIALRAMSPAVNDPTTAISCVDQLSSIVIRWAGREPPEEQFYDRPHVVRLVLPWIDFTGLLDLAFEQIRHYAASDAAVSLRLLRAFCDIAAATENPEIRRMLRERGRRLIVGCTEKLDDGDLVRLRERLTPLLDGAPE